VVATIRFCSQGVSFNLKNKKEVRSWLMQVIRDENQRCGEITFVFCNDRYLLELNKTYLNHDTLTDIITFPVEDDKGKISGDIFISVERVSENAEKFHQQFGQEIKRVMVHGVLHLLGYSDKGKKAKSEMTGREDHYLGKFESSDYVSRAR
jgi:probable rRNA maturation factor